jgi:hypothetical protein
MPAASKFDEIGHLARRHGRVSHSIYRQRLRWSRLLGESEEMKGKGSFLFKPFVNRFVPRFNGFSFPLARANEYEADATAVRLTSSGALAGALTSMEVVARYLAEDYWARIDDEADEQARPTREPYFGMGHAVFTDLDEASARAWQEQAMAEQSTWEDTHRALSERLMAIGEEPSFVPPASGQAVDRLLGPSMDLITGASDRRWKNNVLAAWQSRYQEIQEARHRLTELDEKLVTDLDFTVQEAYELAELTESLAKSPNRARACSTEVRYDSSRHCHQHNSCLLCC